MFDIPIIFYHTTYATIDPMKVLLVSPKDPLPEEITDTKFLVGGENTYTQNLLSNPPSGVEYIHQNQALKKGKIAYTIFQQSLSSLITLKILPPDAGFQCLELKEKFDLIHCHGYCLRLKTPPRCLTSSTSEVEKVGEVPVVLSDSSSNYLFLKDYLGWSKKRIGLVYKLRGWLSKKLDIYDPNLNLAKAKKLIIWSNFAKKVHQDLGCDPKKIVVIPPGIEKLPTKKVKHQGFNILFVGIWFKRKGGDLVLKAYKIIKEKFPEINLTLIGQLPKNIKLPKDVWHKDYLPREKLVRDVYPKADILVLVPGLAEGYGLVVLEAASLGIPSIVSSVYALPEIVQDQETGFVIPPDNLKVLTNRLEKLINNKVLLEKMGQKAKKRFEKKFWIKKTNKELLRAYREAISNNINNPFP